LGERNLGPRWEEKRKVLGIARAWRREKGFGFG
jgi:hypothetical protein